MVDDLVAGDDLHRLLAVEARKGVERVVQQVGGVLADRADHVVVGEAGRAALVQAFRGARDLARLVADALEVGDDLDRGHDGAQVVGGRLALDDQVAAGVVELHFELVDGVVVRHHLVGLGDVADPEAVQRLLELGFHHAAHQQDLGTDRFEFLVVLL